MARKRIGMKKIKEVIRLKSTTEMNDRQIAKALNMSHLVVAKYWQGFNFFLLCYRTFLLLTACSLEQGRTVKTVVEKAPAFGNGLDISPDRGLS